MHSLLWLLVLAVLGLLLAPLLGLVLVYAIGSEERLFWIALLAIITALATFAGWIVWRADRRESALKRAS